MIRVEDVLARLGPPAAKPSPRSHFRKVPWRRRPPQSWEDRAEVFGEILAALKAGELLSNVLRRPDMPSLGSFYKYKRAHPEYAAELALAMMGRPAVKLDALPQHVWERVLNRMADGVSFRDRNRPAGLPARDQIRRNMLRDPVFAERVRAIRSNRIRQSKGGLDLFEQIARVVPKSLPRQVRDDVIQEIAMAVLDGDIPRSGIKAAVQDYIRSEYRMFSNFGPRSLDEVLFEDGTTTLGDTLTNDDIRPF